MITVNGPNGVTINFPEGTDAGTIDRVMQQAIGGGGKSDDFVAPAPPPGAMIHEAGRSYIAGQPGKAPEYAAAVPQGTSPEDRQLMSAALQGRADMGGSATRRLTPAFQGVSSSFGDEAVSGLYGAAGAVQGGSFSDAYNYAQEIQRQELEQNRAERPIESVVGQMGGAVLQAPAIAVKGLQAAQGMSLGGKVAASAGGGLVYGGFEGFGSGSGFDDRMEKAGWGAGVGAATGAAIPVASGVFSKGAQMLLDNQTVNKSLKAVGLDRAAGDNLMRVLDADDAFSGSGSRNIQAAGPDGMLVDAGPTARGVLDTAMQRGGPATKTAKQAVVERTRTAYQNLTSALDRTLGVPEGVETATTSIREGTKAARHHAYEDVAYNAPINYSAPEAKRLENLLKRVPQKAISAANELMRVGGHESKHILADIADDGTVTFRQMPDVRQIDYITRGLKHAAQTGEGQGTMGGQTQIGGAYDGLAKQIRSTLRGLVPEYGQALDTAADPISRIQAVKFGRDMFNPNVARDVVAREAKDMSKAELAAGRQGIRSHIDEVLANVRAVASDPNLDAKEAMQALKMLSSRAAREKIALFLEPKEAHGLFSEIGRASKALELYAGVARNSATFARTATDDAVKQAREPGVVGLAKRGKFLESGKRMFQTATGTTPQDELAMDDEMYRQLAEALTSQRGPQAQTAMQSLTDAYRVGPVNKARAGAIGRDLGAGTGLSLYQLGQQYLDSRPQR